MLSPNMSLACAILGGLLGGVPQPKGAFLAPSPAQDAREGELRSAEITERMRTLERAASTCAWDEVIAGARAVRALAYPGSAAWFEACGRALEARYQRWEPVEVLALWSEISAAEAIVESGSPFPNGWRMPALDARTRSFVASARLNVARVHAARSEHEAAVLFLGPLIRELRERPCDGAGPLIANAAVLAGRCLKLLGREAEARQALESLRDNFPGSGEGAVASVLLQQGPDGVGAYRGKFEGDPAHRERMLALRELVPRARARLAARLGRRVEEVPQVPVGVADAPIGASGIGGFTIGNPRIGDLGPIVVLFSELLALEAFDVEQTLVHELAHAVLIAEVGVRYERLPSWLIEGIPTELAGQAQAQVDGQLAQWLFLDPAGFLRPDFWSNRDLGPSADVCGKVYFPHDGLLLAKLDRERGLEGLRELVAGLRGPESLDRIFERLASGQSMGQFARAAEVDLMARLEARRQAALPEVAALLEAQAKGPEALAERAGRIPVDGTPAFVRAFARWTLAETLETRGRHAEALESYDRLLGPEHGAYSEVVHGARARCLLALDRTEEARRELELLRRAALGPDRAKWADDLLRELGRR
jgi:tetratricopeptide (TPR) repeat protein